LTTNEALHELGVDGDTITKEEKQQLDENGFLLLHHVLTPRQVEQMRARVDDLHAEEGELAGHEMGQVETGVLRLSDLVNKDPLFEVCFTHPRVLAAVHHVLRGEMKLFSLNSRAALPGHGHQGLHPDWYGAVAPGDHHVCNTAWLLNDYTEENGPTRVVPGSHRSGKMPQDELSDLNLPHPDEVKVTGPAGTVVVFNSHTWHSGTLNTSAEPRRALNSAFCRRDIPQQTDQRKYIRPETQARLGEAARYLLDV